VAKVIGNGLTAEFGPDGSELFIIAVTSISMDSAERPAIDITAADDAQRVAVPGLRGVSTGSVTGVLEQVADASEIRAIELQLTSCTAIACRIKAKEANCTSDATLVDSTVHVSGFTIDGSIDEAVSITVNFMLAADETFVAPA
jgi:hypothetical protein